MKLSHRVAVVERSQPTKFLERNARPICLIAHPQNPNRPDKRDVHELVDEHDADGHGNSTPIFFRKRYETCANSMIPAIEGIVVELEWFDIED